MQIAAYMISELTNKVLKLNRRAKKLGLDPVTYTVSPIYAEEVPRGTRGAFCNAEGKTIKEFVDITFTSEAPALSDWQFIAAVDLKGSAPVVRRAVGTDESIDLTPYFSTDAHCDHCHTHRNRNDVLVVRHRDTGKMMQVGRNCAADFFRSKDAEKVINLWDGIHSMGAEEEFCNLPRGELYMSLEHVLVYACAVVRNFGFVSKRIAMEQEKVATAWRVTDNLFFRRQIDASERVTPTAADEAKAKEIMEWIETDFIQKENRTEFENNIVAVIEGDKHDRIRDRNLAFVTWMPDGLDRAKGRKAARAAAAQKAAASAWIGDKGQRMDFTGTLVMTRTFEGAYGPTTMCKFDCDGNAVIWFGTGAAVTKMEQGNAYTFKATVKAHDDYNGQKQTKITRLTLAG